MHIFFIGVLPDYPRYLKAIPCPAGNLVPVIYERDRPVTMVALPKGTEVKGFTTYVQESLPPISFLHGEGKPQGNSREPKHPHGRERTPEVGDCPLVLPFFRTRE